MQAHEVVEAPAHRLLIAPPSLLCFPPHLHAPLPDPSPHQNYILAPRSPPDLSLLRSPPPRYFHRIPFAYMASIHENAPRAPESVRARVQVGAAPSPERTRPRPRRRRCIPTLRPRPRPPVTHMRADVAPIPRPPDPTPAHPARPRYLPKPVGSRSPSPPMRCAALRRLHGRSARRNSTPPLPSARETAISVPRRTRAGFRPCRPAAKILR